MKEFFDIYRLMTFGGAAMAVCAVTQVVKPLLKKLPFEVDVQLVSYITALIILAVATALTGGKAVDYFVCLINAALVSLSANGGYDLVRTLMKGDIEEDNDIENNS